MRQDAAPLPLERNDSLTTKMSPQTRKHHENIKSMFSKHKRFSMHPGEIRGPTSASRKSSNESNIRNQKQSRDESFEEAKSEQSRSDSAEAINTDTMGAHHHRHQFKVKKRPKRHRKYKFQTHHKQLLRVP
jgi:hypothetical protein